MCFSTQIFIMISSVPPLRLYAFASSWVGVDRMLREEAFMAGRVQVSMKVGGGNELRKQQSCKIVLIRMFSTNCFSFGHSQLA